MKINENHDFSWYCDFHGRARLWQSCRVVQSAEKNIFHEKNVFFLGNKNTAHFVSDIVTGMGVVCERSKHQISWFFLKILEIHRFGLMRRLSRVAGRWALERSNEGQKSNGIDARGRRRRPRVQKHVRNDASVVPTDFHDHRRSQIDFWSRSPKLSFFWRFCHFTKLLSEYH